MFNLLYRCFTVVYPFAIRLVAPFNPKAMQWVNGRRSIFQEIKAAVPVGKKIIWMHCSSLGEFEQGRPVLEQLKKIYPDYVWMVTFFSPSGYEVRKDYALADVVCYLPMDSPQNARNFYDIVQPALVIYVKYEFWHYYLQEANRRQIPLLLISAIFRKGQPFFAFYGQFHRRMLSYFSHIFVQDEASVQLLSGIGNRAVSIGGDTRFDRVVEIALENKSFPAIEAFCKGAKVLVAGSTWTDDDKELDHFANTRSHVKCIIAPHNIHADRLKECLQLYKHSVLYSSLSQNVHLEGINTLIIDNVGMLAALYRYATVCYVGGGFGADGVHNVLEAAVYGKPVVHGPEYDKYLEACELVDSGAGIPVDNALALESMLDKLFAEDEQYQEHCKAAREYVLSKNGATQRIVDFIQEKRLLTI